jgi:hypothetical protein
MKGLMLHCGGEEVTLDQVIEATTPAPTKTWQPIPHANLVSVVEETIRRSGLNIVQAQHGLDHGGDRYYGLMQVANGRQDDEYGTVIGLRNSHDKVFPASLAVGAGVFVCDNLSFSGEIVIGRKHTTHIKRDLPRIVETAVGQVAKARVDQELRFAIYRDAKLDDSNVHDLLVQAMDIQAISAPMIPKVLKEWREPSHEEFEGRNMWSLFNGFTEILKSIKPQYVPRRTMALHGLLDSFAGVTLSS